jgi:hypothetical protein
VIARLADGESALVCLGATRGEVIVGARTRAAALEPRVDCLLLQQWVGRVGRGRWQTMPLKRAELAARGRRPRRRRQEVLQA